MLGLGELCRLICVFANLQLLVYSRYWHTMPIISLVGKSATTELADKIRRACVHMCACVYAHCVCVCVLGLGELCRPICVFANLQLLVYSRYWNTMPIISLVGKSATTELADKIRRACVRVCACVSITVCVCVCARACVCMCLGWRSCAG